MPKMKTKRAAAKRFKPRASGSIKRAHATKRHILTKRTTKNKRHARSWMQRLREKGALDMVMVKGKGVYSKKQR